MPYSLKRWTLDELHRLPDDGNKYELVRGELFVTPAPSTAHEAIINALAHVLDPFVMAHGLGQIFRPRAVVRLEDSETEPDLMVRRALRPPPADWAEMPRPILVVEVLSDSTRRRDRVQKRGLYVDSRIPDYWIVDGDERTVCVVRPGRDDVTCDDRVRWAPAGASDALEIDLRILFAVALGDR
jgi:Uma2 family endonuclease